MTPDQLHTVVVELGGLAAAVFANVRFKKKISQTQCAVEEDQVARLEAEAKLTREELRQTRDQMTRLEVRMELGEKIAEQHRVEMHALSGRVDAANVTYTEMLSLAKAKAKIEPGKKPDIQDQTKITIGKEEKKK